MTAATWLVLTVITVPCVVPLLLLTRARVRRSKRAIALLIGLQIVLLFAHPLGNMVLLARLDWELRGRMFRKASEARLVGAEPATVRAVLGSPCGVRSLTSSVAWDYEPCPICYASGWEHFKVVFREGRVSSFKSGRPCEIEPRPRACEGHVLGDPGLIPLL